MRDANQSFSSCIRAVEAGEDFIITRNGKPVARLAPLSSDHALTGQQREALAHFRDVARKGWKSSAARPDRDSLHEPTPGNRA